MKNKIILLIHGPYSGNAYHEIFDELDRLSERDRKKLTIAAAVYQTDYQQTKELLELIAAVWHVQFVIVKDLLNPGFYNINRQINMVSNGLKGLPDNAFILKLRNDQWVDFRKLFHILNKNEWMKDTPEKILTTNCYTRKDRLYHPSDMFLCAWKQAMQQYYACPFQEKTHVGQQMELVETAQKYPEQWDRQFTCPESILAKNYLKLKNWELKYTKEDSYLALKKYFWIINSWDIGFRWKKDRNPVIGAGSIILPCYFDIPPFPGAPVEHARCYLASDFGKRAAFKDRYYCMKTKVLFDIGFNGRDKIIRLGYRILNAKWMPRFMISLLRRTALLRMWRKIVLG